MALKCVIATEGFGDMVFELYPESAPITTAIRPRPFRSAVADKQLPAPSVVPVFRPVVPS